jgi:aminoglycoside phosphotransferase (APT) family kinase protein
VPPREALLLLPRLPATARTSGTAERWTDALRSLGVAVGTGPTPAAPDLVLVRHVREALRAPADVLLVDGRDPLRRLRRAGFEVRSYAAERGPGGAVGLVPVGPSPRSRPSPAAERMAGRTPRQRLVALARRCSGRAHVTVAARGPVDPAAVRAAGLSGPAPVLLAGGGGARRRSTFLVPATGPAGPAVVKVGPLSGWERGAQEQRVLRRLAALDRLPSAVPRPLGAGTVGPLCWSAESALAGQPLPDALRHHSAGAGRAVLEEVASWLTALAEQTRTSGTSWDARTSALPLRGEHGRSAELRSELAGVPAVLVHGDVGTGGNVLVGHQGLGVIDWETAHDTELPLTDLLPLLALALASRQRPDDRASYVLRLCGGQEEDSDWLFALLRGYCRRVDVLPRHVGALGGLAWAYQASMRLVHDELLAADGEPPTRWRSPAEEVARSWSSHPGLGADWPALTSGWDR